MRYLLFLFASSDVSVKLARDDRSCLYLVVEGALDVTTEIIGLIYFNFCSEGLEFMTSFAA